MGRTKSSSYHHNMAESQNSLQNELNLACCHRSGYQSIYTMFLPSSRLHSFSVSSKLHFYVWTPMATSSTGPKALRDLPRTRAYRITHSVNARPSQYTLPLDQPPGSPSIHAPRRSPVRHRSRYYHQTSASTSYNLFLPVHGSNTRLSTDEHIMPTPSLIISAAPGPT